jgi:hypothetical protein
MPESAAELCTPTFTATYRRRSDNACYIQPSRAAAYLRSSGDVNQSTPDNSEVLGGFADA